jgi:SAM-dependent methyltransferase
VEKKWPFDSDWTQNYTKIRQAFIRELLGLARVQVELVTALDVGCGVGYFSKFLSELGFRVVAIDGREENAQEGKRRHPEITFLTRDAEDPALPEIGTFDFVLCVGLLYHLENPFRTVRNLFALTGKLLVVESMCAPGDQPTMELLDEYHEEDQGLSHVAFYPTESCLVKMLYRAGFPFVYGFRQLPSHPAFCATRSRQKKRTMLAASRQNLSTGGLTVIPEPQRSWDIWSKSRFWGMRARLGRVAHKIKDCIKVTGSE